MTVTLVVGTSEEPAGTRPARVRVQTLGDFVVHIDDEQVRSWRAGKARSLFQYLVLHRGRMVLRETLHDLLWPAAEGGPSSSSLKVAMHALRQILRITPSGDDERGMRIVHQSFGYVLHADDVEVDVERFEALMDAGRVADRRGDTETALARYTEGMEVYQGDFLAGETAEWAVGHREWCRAIALRALDRLCEEAMMRDDVADVLAWCRRIIDLDPCREETYQTLIELHGRLGEFGAARRWYDLCARRLEVDLDVPPDVQTDRAYRRALRMETRGGGEVRRPGRPGAAGPRGGVSHLEPARAERRLNRAG